VYSTALDKRFATIEKSIERSVSTTRDGEMWKVTVSPRFTAATA
jgi:hypothetical protein